MSEKCNFIIILYFLQVCLKHGIQCKRELFFPFLFYYIRNITYQLFAGSGSASVGIVLSFFFVSFSLVFSLSCRVLSSFFWVVKRSLYPSSFFFSFICVEKDGILPLLLGLLSPERLMGEEPSFHHCKSFSDIYPSLGKASKHLVEKKSFWLIFFSLFSDMLQLDYVVLERLLLTLFLPLSQPVVLDYILDGFTYKCWNNLFPRCSGLYGLIVQYV